MLVSIVQLSVDIEIFFLMVAYACMSFLWQCDYQLCCWGLDWNRLRFSRCITSSPLRPKHSLQWFACYIVSLWVHRMYFTVPSNRYFTTQVVWLQCNMFVNMAACLLAFTIMLKVWQERCVHVGIVTCCAYTQGVDWVGCVTFMLCWAHCFLIALVRNTYATCIYVCSNTDILLLQLANAGIYVRVYLR